MEQQKTLSKVVAKAWSDPKYKAKLLSDPSAALAEVGVTVAPGHTIKVVEDTATVQHFILPQPPKSGELSEEELASAAGGGSTSVKMSAKGITTK